MDDCRTFDDGTNDPDFAGFDADGAPTFFDGEGIPDGIEKARFVGRGGMTDEEITETLAAAHDREVEVLERRGLRDLSQESFEVDRHA